MSEIHAYQSSQGSLEIRLAEFKTNSQSLCEPVITFIYIDILNSKVVFYQNSLNYIFLNKPNKAFMVEVHSNIYTEKAQYHFAALQSNLKNCYTQSF